MPDSIGTAPRHRSCELGLRGEPVVDSGVVGTRVDKDQLPPRTSQAGGNFGSDPAGGAGHDGHAAGSPLGAAVYALAGFLALDERGDVEGRNWVVAHGTSVSS